MNTDGLVIALVSFVVIGLFHPLVIKGEYYFGTRIWWLFLLAGLAALAASVMVSHLVCSAGLGVLGCTCLWSIGELFHQRKRVERGWFPKGPSHLREQHKPHPNKETKA